MFWEDVEPIENAALERSVARAYDVFAKYTLSGTIIYCDCPVCMTAENARALSSLPLKDISAPLLAEYTNSAHGYDTGQIETEFKHFLPRYLDLIAQCSPPSHLGLEICLDRLGEAGYRNAWPRQESEAVDTFFDVFLNTSLDQLTLAEWPVGLRLEFDIGEVLGMVVRAGGDLERALEAFDKGKDPQAAVHMASLRGELRYRRGCPRYDNEHLADCPDAADKIGAWLMRDSVSARILHAVEALQDPNYDDVLALGM